MRRVNHVSQVKVWRAVPSAWGCVVKRHWGIHKVEWTEKVDPPTPPHPFHPSPVMNPHTITPTRSWTSTQSFVFLFKSCHTSNPRAYHTLNTWNIRIFVSHPLSSILFIKVVSMLKIQTLATQRTREISGSLKFFLFLPSFLSKSGPAQNPHF